MRNASQIRDLPVVDLQGGTRVGRVGQLVISPDDGGLLGIVVRSGGLFDARDRIVANDAIRAIGPDAVTISSADAALAEEEAAESIRTALRGDRQLLGTRVMTQGGRDVGKVDDLAIDEERRRVAALIVGKGALAGGDAIPAERLISLGPDVAIIRDQGDAAEAAAPEGDAAASQPNRDIHP